MTGYIEFGRDMWKHQLIFPRAPSVHKFFDLLNISKQIKKAHVSKGCCSFHFLYFRFEHSAGFKTHEKRLSNKQDKGIWQIHRRFAFIVAFLGIMVFPNEKGTMDTRTVRFAQIFTTREDHTLVLLILADIYWALTICKARDPFFEGCNILLQMWFIEHLRHHPRFLSYGSSPNDFIISYEERVKDYSMPEGFEAWISPLKALKASQIEWIIGWIPMTEAIYMTATKCYLRLMGVRSIHPYAAKRVLSLLGRY